jgi:predicted nucleotidyltransferase
MVGPAHLRIERREFLTEDPVRRARVGEVLRSAGIGLAVVHGSRVRGAERPDSDLDVALLAANARPLSYAAMGSIALDLSHVLGAEVDVSDLSTPDAIFRYEVAGCARVLFQDRPDAFTDFLAKAMIDYSDIQRFLPELVAGVARGRRRMATVALPSGEHER